MNNYPKPPHNIQGVLCYVMQTRNFSEDEAYDHVHEMYYHLAEFETGESTYNSKEEIISDWLGLDESYLFLFD